MPPVFTIGWVCALPVELAAARVVMDEEYDPLPMPPTDTNIYAFGRIGVHNVVAACLPAGQMGTNSAAVVASQMWNSFPSLSLSILVGIGGGVPSDENDIRLGDVVISQRSAQSGGVVQFEFGKTGRRSEIIRTGSLDAPPTILLDALNKLRANILQPKLHTEKHLSAFSGLDRFTCPGSKEDVLYSVSSKHMPGPTCAFCSEDDIIVRQARTTPDPFLFFGTIASGNQIVKDASIRDITSQKLGGVLCFEMEAAGLMNNFECLVIRGICDYADAHRNKQWQPYAAATATACAKELLLHIPQGVSATENSQTVHDTSEHLPITSPLSAEDQDCLRSLAFPEQESRGQEIHFEQNTGQWLLEDYQYQEWTKKTSGLFWIKGKPGTGKSALMKSAAAAMRREQSMSLVLSYFIHGRGTDLQKSPFGVFRALLNALLASFPQKLSQLTKVFEDREARYGSKQAMSRSWAAQELRDCMLETLRKETKDKPVVIFIDALDECGEHDAKALLSYFRDLMRQIEVEGGKVRICFSSRHYPIITGSDDIPTISVEDQNGGDIQSVVHQRLKQIATEDMRRQIEEQILSKSQGVFLWAVLVTNRILDGDATGMEEADLLEMLSTFPETLDGLYGAILSSSTGAEKQQMVKLFQWILFARRPLSSQELREALETDGDMASATHDLVESNGSSVENLSEFENFEKHVKQLSRGLVEFQNHDIWEQYKPDEELWNREARFIHRSVADYLFESFLPHHEENLITTRSVMGAGHLEISKSCFRSITLSSDVQVGTSMIHVPLVPRFPLVLYAIQFLLYHIEKVIQEGISEVDIRSSLQWDHQSNNLGRMDRLWKLIKPDRADAPLSDTAYLFGALSGPRKYGMATQAQLIGAAEAGSEMALPYSGIWVSMTPENSHRLITNNAPDDDLMKEYRNSPATQLEDDEFISTLADDLYSDILGLVHDTKSSIGTLKDYEIWNQAVASLPELLQEFVLSTRFSAENQTQRETMEFIHKNRERITQKLWISYICDSRSSSLNETSAISKNGETGDKNDKILNWMDGSLDANKPELSAEPPDLIPPPDLETDEKVGMPPRDLDEFQDGIVGGASGEGSKSIETEVGGRLNIYRNQIRNLKSYQWLRSRLHRKFLMTSAEPDILTDIKQQIIDQLPPLRRTQHRMSSDPYYVTFRVEWSPHSFLDQQGYLGEPDDAISNALTLTGTTSDAQAMSCAEYLCRTWPLTGKVLLKLILAIVQDDIGVEHTADLFDQTNISARTEVSRLVVTAKGTRALLAELGQQLAWLGSALPIGQEQTDQPASNHCRPYLFQRQENRRSASILAVHPVWDIRFGMKKIENQRENPNGQCWTSLIRNRVLVQGYPIFRRSEPGTGLEVALHDISWLLQAPYATVFDGRPFIKGIRMMLILAKHSENSLIWHLLEGDDESRIAYIDTQIPGIPPKEASISDLKDLESSRHFVGWCSRSISLVGTPHANYDIGASNLDSGDHCPFSLRSIQPGVPISSRNSPSVPQNESAINVPTQRQQGYFERLQYLNSESVALFDSEDNRSWLVDGVSALLHLVRSSLDSERRNALSRDWYEFKMEEYRDSQRSSNNPSFAILANRNNLDKPLFNEDCDGNPETFRQRVEKIWSFLDLIIDTEKSLNKQDHPCISLEGYEFHEVAAAIPDRRVFRHSMELIPEGDASISLCRELNAVTLVGKGFGELIQPDPVEVEGLCNPWKLVPKGKGYICVQTRHLKLLMEKRIDQQSRLWGHINNLLRNKSHLIRATACERHEGDPCDHAQTLQMSDQHDGLKDSTVYKASDDSTPHSAVIFGRCSHSSDKKIELSNKDDSHASDVFSNTTLVPESTSATSFTSPKHTTFPNLSPRFKHYSLSSTSARNTSTSNTPKIAHPEDNHETNQPQNNRDNQSALETNQESDSLNFMLYGAVVVGCFMIENFYWTTFSLSWMLFILFYHKWKPTRAWVRVAKYFCVAALFVWLIVLSPLHVLLPTLLDLWTPYQATFDSAPYEIIYDRGDFSYGDISVDVFAIHGLGSNASRAWVSRDGSDIHWLRDILPRHTKLKNIRVVLLNHHTFWASHSPTMTFHDHARSMLHHIRDVNQGKNPIIFVAHSFGGLLLKQALLYAQSQGNDVALKTKGILFLGVPHHGASNTLVARLLACTAYWRGSSDAILKLLSTHKRDLQELDNAFRESFTHSSRHDSTIRPHITNFLEMRPEKLGAFSLKETVDREYGELGYARNIFLDTDHRGLNKFGSSDDANFRTFLSQFLAAFEHETKGLSKNH